MKLADIPAKIPTPFAVAAGPGFIRTIPATPGATPGAASFSLGFPPDTFLPTASGGIPPAGEDFNGLLNVMSAWDQWSSAGNPVAFDGTFAAVIGGYPKGALLLSADATHWWLSKVDDNATDPASDATNWTAIGPFGNIMSLNAGAGLFIDVGTETLNALGFGDVYVNASQLLMPGSYTVDASLVINGPVLQLTPTPVKGMGYSFTDFGETWGNPYPWTMDCNGKTVGTPQLGQIASMTVRACNSRFAIEYNGTYWRLN